MNLRVLFLKHVLLDDPLTLLLGVGVECARGLSKLYVLAAQHALPSLDFLIVELLNRLAVCLVLRHHRCELVHGVFDVTPHKGHVVGEQTTIWLPEHALVRRLIRSRLGLRWRHGWLLSTQEWRRCRVRRRRFAFCRHLHGLAELRPPYTHLMRKQGGLSCVKGRVR